MGKFSNVSPEIFLTSMEMGVNAPLSIMCVGFGELADIAKTYLAEKRAEEAQNQNSNGGGGGY